MTGPLERASKWCHPPVNLGEVSAVFKRYAVPEPSAHGMLDVGDDNRIYWQVRGRGDGKPAVVVHGGPGGPFARGGYRGFDPDVYKLVLFDQRGCGRSTPHASHPTVDMRHNTTDHLITDMERLREHLGIDRWLVYGYSWGSALSLAYAERHPERVSEMILASVMTGGRRDIDWLYGGAARFYPDAWERFSAVLPEPSPVADILTAYSQLMENPDLAVREKAADAWSAWEDTLLAWETGDGPGVFSGRDRDAKLALIRICAHYFSHSLFLDDETLIRHAHRLEGIPGVIVQGRFDIGLGTRAAWDLARAWPGAELLIAEDAGHFDSDFKIQSIYDAISRFALPHTPDGPTTRTGAL